MKRLSMTHTLAGAQRSLRRFPFVLLCAVVATYCSIELMDHSSIEGILDQILMASVLGIPFLLTLALALENLNVPPWPKRLIRIAGLLVPILYFLTLPSDPPDSHVFRFFFLFIGCHFLVSVAPFLRQNPGQAFWQFNKELLLRLISSLLFTVVMYAGLSLALAALDNLLGISLPDDIYLKLFMFLGFVFNTWYFLGGIPEAPLALNDDDDFPQPLRIFAQYILSTLVLVYLAILVAYLGKVILTGIWPSGWIGWLVSGVAVAGLLSVVLLSPLQGRQGHRWVGIYFRIFHLLMLPSVVMLILAVSKRINQYGLTELRYLLVVLSGWVLVILLLGLFAKRVNIRLIPLSLGLLAVGISLGPWGVVSMSLHSQKDRLETELTAAGLFSDDRLVPALSGSTSLNRGEITNSFQYLIDHFGLEELDSWLTPEMHDSLNIEDKHRNSWAKAKLIVDELGLLPNPDSPDTPFLIHTLLGEGRLSALNVSGFEYALALEIHPGSIADFTWGAVRGEVALAESGDKLVVKREDRVLLEMPLGEMFQDLFNAGDSSEPTHVFSPQEMTFDYGNENLKLRLFIYLVVFKDGSDIPLVERLEGLLLLEDAVDLVPAGE